MKTTFTFIINLIFAFIGIISLISILNFFYFYFQSRELYSVIKKVNLNSNKYFKILPRNLELFTILNENNENSNMILKDLYVSLNVFNYECNFHYKLINEIEFNNHFNISENLSNDKLIKFINYDKFDSQITPNNLFFTTDPLNYINLHSIKNDILKKKKNTIHSIYNNIQNSYQLNFQICELEICGTDKIELVQTSSSSNDPLLISSLTSSKRFNEKFVNYLDNLKKLNYDILVSKSSFCIPQDYSNNKLNYYIEIDQLLSEKNKLECENCKYVPLIINNIENDLSKDEDINNLLSYLITSPFDITFDVLLELILYQKFNKSIDINNLKLIRSESFLPNQKYLNSCSSIVLHAYLERIYLSEFLLLRTLVKLERQFESFFLLDYWQMITLFYYNPSITLIPSIISRGINFLKLIEPSKINLESKFSDFLPFDSNNTYNDLFYYSNIIYSLQSISESFHDVLVEALSSSPLYFLILLTPFWIPLMLPLFRVIKTLYA